MIEFEPTEQQCMLQETARRFADEHVTPAARKIRAQPHNEGAPWDVIRPIFAKGADLGLMRLLIPEQFGGLGGSCLDHVLIMEELGAADHGIASTYFNISAVAPLIILHGGTQQQRDEWLPAIAGADDYVLASASSEPDVAGADSFSPDPDPRIGLKSTAVRDGDIWRLNGAKSGFCTNAGAAKAYFVMARTSLDRPARGSTAMFMVPAGTPGLSIGKRTQLIGWDTSMEAEVLLDNVEIPVNHRVGGDDADAGEIFFRILPHLAAGFAATFVGLARTAFETAFAYAHERVSWGRPIIEHQAVALKLADMAVDLETARLLVWRLAAAADRGDPMAGALYAPAAKTHAVEVAIRNAQKAVKILGSYGVTREYPAGRLLTDAWIGDSCDGTHDMLRLNLVTALRMMRGQLAPPGAPPGQEEHTKP